MDKKEPLLSVIVTVYGTEEFLPKCLESILTCSYSNIELIVVDDKSPGNIDEIMNVYTKHYTNIIYVKHDVNKGLYHARITGVENSHGQYLAFLDSDDHVSCDFYRRLIYKAIETDSDMVIGEYLLEYEDGKLKYQNLAHTRILDIDLKDREVSDLLFNQHGLDFSLHVVWNKIYRRDLWERCYPYCVLQTQHLIMCEDILYSSIFYYFAKHITNIHGDFIYYVQHEKSSTALSGSYMKNVKNVKNVFHFLKQLFKNKLEEVAYAEKIGEWQKLLKKIWKDNIKKSGLKQSQIIELFNVLEIDCHENNELTSRDNYFYSLYTEVQDLASEKLKLKLLDTNTEVVSFDVFDTLIVRPFLNPTDLFYFLDIKANDILNITDKINFSLIRIEAEKRAREKNRIGNPMIEEITLESIYESIYDMTNFSKSALEKLQKYEIELECKYCYKRNFTKEIYELAVYLGKRIIITSDMYLPKKVIKEILEKNGYLNQEKIYVSSDINLTKSTGNLYKYIIKDLNIDASRIIHIGDNKQSDIEQAKHCGLNTFYLPKTTDILENKVSIYGGEAFTNVFLKAFMLRRSFSILEYSGIRIFLGIIANKLYDNPFININQDSDFNADPRSIGYAVLGMHLFSLGQWLAENVHKEEYNNLNFMARDGFLPMRTYEIINKIYNNNTVINYLHLTRRSIIPIQIANQHDLYSLMTNLNFYSQSPNSIISLLEDFLERQFVHDAKDLCEKRGFIFEKHFENQVSFNLFLKFLSLHIEYKKLNEYKDIFGKYISKFFLGKTATFDVGYSCRIESALKKAYDFDIHPYYIHINNDLPIMREHQKNIEISTFFDFSPGVTGVLRELLISKMEPSCSKLVLKSGEFIPEFKSYLEDYYENFIIGNIQKAALNFVYDVVDILGEDIKLLCYQRQDASLLHEYFSASPKYFDKLLFAPLSFEDDLGLGKKVNLLDFWNGQIDAVTGSLGQNMETSLSWVFPLWKRAICLYFLNRNLLKRKIENRYRNKIQLKIIKSLYRYFRFIYRKF